MKASTRNFSQAPSGFEREVEARHDQDGNVQCAGVDEQLNEPIHCTDSLADALEARWTGQ